MIQSVIDWIMPRVVIFRDILLAILTSESIWFLTIVTTMLMLTNTAPMLMMVMAVLFLIMMGAEVFFYRREKEKNRNNSSSSDDSSNSKSTGIAGRDCYVCNGTVEEKVNGKLTVNKEGRDGGISEFSVPLCKVCTVSYSTLMDEGVSFQEMDHRGEPEEV